ncbi:hypothetical protein [Sulfurimonas sp.]|uniref:hypothetical protein n=1 Tax=Sulfurimonas sp. TaxID=2022749 RepID=UPI003D14FED9
MTTTEYQKAYKKSYSQKNKIVTFPLSIPFYDELKRRAILFDVSVNTYAKNIVNGSLNSSSVTILTQEKQEIINEYIRISRGIANNINQIAHQTNITEQIDISILINALKNYEEEFKKLIQKI